jgi:hypothetical protein
MSMDRDAVIRLALKQLQAARTSIESAELFLDAAMGADESRTPPDELVAAEFSYFGAPLPAETSSMDARTRLHARRMTDVRDVKPLTRDIIRAGSRTAADATGAADSQLSTE